MTKKSQRRQPSGTPQGGQYAPGPTAKTLTGNDLCLQETELPPTIQKTVVKTLGRNRASRTITTDNDGKWHNPSIFGQPTLRRLITRCEETPGEVMDYTLLVSIDMFNENEADPGNKNHHKAISEGVMVGGYLMGGRGAWAEALEIQSELLPETSTIRAMAQMHTIQYLLEQFENGEAMSFWPAPLPKEYPSSQDVKMLDADGIFSKYLFCEYESVPYLGGDNKMVEKYANLALGRSECTALNYLNVDLDDISDDVAHTNKILKRIPEQHKYETACIAAYILSEDKPPKHLWNNAKKYLETLPPDKSNRLFMAMGTFEGIVRKHLDSHNLPYEDTRSLKAIKAMTKLSPTSRIGELAGAFVEHRL